MELEIERSNFTQVNLQIPVELQRDGWHRSQQQHTTANQWQGYLNYLCLSVSLPWLANSFSGRIQSWDLECEAASFWELVEGSIVTVGEYKLCLLPHTSCDRHELRVPREWVEIPGAIADYYLAVQIDLDDRQATVWGYTTHQRIIELGSYDDLDRMYAVGVEDLIQDLSILQLTEQLSPLQSTRGAVNPLEPLSHTQADNYITTWSSPKFAVPRLDIGEADFPDWLSFLSNDSWRQQLTERRFGIVAPVALTE
jgi:Protein of unknown function (DUF1822)